MKHALVLLLALTGHYSMMLGRTSCATLARARHWRGNGFTRVARLAAILGGIFLAGCAGQPRLQPAPVILNLPDCPAPAAPLLPLLDPSAPLDAPENAACLMQRDDMTRQYIDGLRAAITCYRRGNNEPR